MCCFGTEQRFTDAAGWPALRIGDQPVWASRALVGSSRICCAIRPHRRHGPSIVVRVLAALLAVWTVLLALPQAARFFPSPVWQYGWVAFDVALFVALFSLARRWRH